MSRLYKDKSLWLHGFVNLRKPCGMTSSDAVCIVRGALSAAVGGRQKAGHLGTLDPLAEGVLPIALGNAAKLFDYLAFKRKKYLAEFRFGCTTDTLDRGGEITESGGRVPDESEIVEAAQRLTGEIMQIPPAYSAKSVNGRRAYKYAREGEIVNLPAQQVTVYAFNPTGRTGADSYSFEIECGGGTYIRALARDMGEMLGTHAYMTVLTRVASGVFGIENAVSADEFRSDPLKYVLPIGYALDAFPECTLDETTAFRALNGAPVCVRAADMRVKNAGAGAYGQKTLAAAVYGAHGELLGIASAERTDDESKVMLKLKTRL